MSATSGPINVSRESDDLTCFKRAVWAGTVGDDVDGVV